MNDPRTPDEVWKPITGFQDYEVSNHGRIRSYKTPGRYPKRKRVPKIIKTRTKGQQRMYLFAALYKNQERCDRLVHQLVMETFIGPCPPNHMVCHNDSNPQNNCLSNLRYDTARGNALDSVAIGTNYFKNGEQHPHSKLTSKDAVEIRISYAAYQYTQKELAIRYNVKSETINAVITGKTWRHAGGPISIGNEQRKSQRVVQLEKRKELLRQKESAQKQRELEKKHRWVRRIREQYASGQFTLMQLAEIHNRHFATISRIVTGKKWANAGGPIKNGR